MYEGKSGRRKLITVGSQILSLCLATAKFPKEQYERSVKSYEITGGCSVLMRFEIEGMVRSLLALAHTSSVL